MTSIIFKYLLTTLAAISGLAALWFFYGDVTTTAPSILTGQVWFSLAPSSLQVAEAVVSRYIDPCGIIVSLGCSPFLWHPVISTLLQQSAVIVFGILAVLFLLLSRIFSAAHNRNKHLHREGR